jgi:hypothetical protein
MINEHLFLEYFQYKYDKHNRYIHFADVFARTSILMRDRESRKSRANKIFKFNLSKVTS